MIWKKQKDDMVIPMALPSSDILPTQETPKKIVSRPMTYTMEPKLKPKPQTVQPPIQPTLETKKEKKEKTSMRFYEDLFRKKTKNIQDKKQKHTIELEEPIAIPQKATTQTAEESHEVLKPTRKKASEAVLALTKKQQMIEKMFGMHIEDLAIKLNRMERELQQQHEVIAQYAQAEEATLDKLHQMLKKEWYLNGDIAEPILIKYAVHPELAQHQANIKKPKAMIEALFYAQHCHRADIQDMLAQVRRAKQENQSLEEATQSLQEEREAEREKTQQLINEFKEKYTRLQTEYKKKATENQDMTVQIQEVTKQLDEKTVENQTLMTKNEHQQQEIIQLQQQITALKEEKANTQTVIRTPVIHETTEEVIQKTSPSQNEPFHEEAMEEAVDIVDVVEKEVEEKISEIQEIEELDSYVFDEEDLLADLTLFDEDLKEASEAQEEMPYVRLLKEKGYAVERASNAQYDWMVVQGTDEKIPLMYIYYDIEKADDFDGLMKDTNKMYLVFDSKKRLFNGNTKFTSWLLKQNERRKEIEFSFTTVDQLQTVGLNHLNKM